MKSKYCHEPLMVKKHYSKNQWPKIQDKTIYRLPYANDFLEPPILGVPMLCFKKRGCEI